MYQGIVFTEVQTKAFLSMAAAEGLICENGFTDGVFQRNTEYYAKPALVRSILEQFCIAGKVYVDSFTYRALDGELVNNGFIQPYTKEDLIFPFDYLPFDVELYQRLLAEQGYIYTKERIWNLYLELLRNVHELSVLKEKHPTFHPIGTFLYSMMPIDSSEKSDIDYYLKLYDDFRNNPLSSVLGEFINVCSVAYQNDLLSPVAISSGNKSRETDAFEKSPAIKEAEKAVRIENHISEKLHKIYTPSSLKDCVLLIQTDESKAFRKKIDEFILALSGNDNDSLKRIDLEIDNLHREMNRAMNLKHAFQCVGNITACIGVATLGTEASNYATIIGGALVFVNYAVSKLWNPEKKYLWASYGLQLSHESRNWK